LDGAPLVATHFAPDAAHDTGQYIALGGATAVPRGFYKRFGDFMAERGVHVITTDYRGIGDSKLMLPLDSQGKPTLKGFEMNYAQWSTCDLAAAVQWATDRGPTWLVGHSLGGHALGQLPNQALLQAAFFCGSGAGWGGWMPAADRVKVWALWNLIGPVATRMLGYQPMSKFGIGEDIPMGVYTDWKRWCSFPHYFFDDPAPDARAIAAKFAEVRLPVAACVSTDDLWAPPRSRDAFFKGYTGTKVEAIDISAAELGVPQIGHMGYFRKEVGAVLWPKILAWLQSQSLKTI
jgi:predicted alpha/beta hydrolase